jgi:MFS family permease
VNGQRVGRPARLLLDQVSLIAAGGIQPLLTPHCGKRRADCPGLTAKRRQWSSEVTTASYHADGGAMDRKRKILLGLLLFNGLSAAGGGLALMTDWIPEQESWVRDTDFPSSYFPGVILMAVVGGSSLVAATALVKRSDGWQLASIVAGIIMICWIVGEVASIRGFHFLQVIYIVTGALVVAWTPARDSD